MAEETYEIVRRQVLHELSKRPRIQRVNDEINRWSNVELIERISDAIEERLNPRNNDELRRRL